MGPFLWPKPGLSTEIHKDACVCQIHRIEGFSIIEHLVYRLKVLVVHPQQGLVQGQTIFQRIAQMGRDANPFYYSMVDGYGKDSQLLQFSR